MSKAASLPPWEVIPPWQKRVPVSAAPMVPKVRFGHLENTFIPPLPPPPPPPPEPVATPAPPPPNAYRRAVSLPRNPRPVRPRLPSSTQPTDKSPECTNDPSPTKTANPIPPLPVVPENNQVRPRSRNHSSTLPGTLESSPSPPSRPPLPLNTSYPTPPSSTKSPISPQKALENIREGNAFYGNKSLPPPPQPSVIPIDNNNDYNDDYKTPVPARKSRFTSLKKSLSLKILPQGSNGRRSPSALSPTADPQSPTPPTKDIPPDWANTIVPSSSLRRKKSKQLTSPAYNGEVFARIETKGSRVVSIGNDENEVAEYPARSPRTAKTPTGTAPAGTQAPKSLHVRQRSRRLASPGYVQEKFNLADGGRRDGDVIGDVVVSGGRSPGISDEEKRANRNTRQSIRGNETNVTPSRPQRPEKPDRPDSSTFDLPVIYDEKMRPTSPKPEPPPKESSAGPKLIPLKFASASSPKEVSPAGPAQPKLIPLKFLFPPSPEGLEDGSFPYAYESIDDVTDNPPLQVAPLRIKSSEYKAIPESYIDSAPRAPNNESTTQMSNTDSAYATQAPGNESATQAPTSVTARLISRAAPRKLYSATHSTFLRRCSDVRITIPVLSRYLTQECIFLRHYLRFIALLLANVSTPSRPALRSPISPSQTPKSTKVERGINARLTSHLITRLSHTQNQLSLFSSLEADIPGLSLENWEEATEDGMTDATRMTGRLLDVIGTAVERGEKSVLVGVVVFWAREKVCPPF